MKPRNPEVSPRSWTAPPPSRWPAMNPPTGAVVDAEFSDVDDFALRPGVRPGRGGIEQMPMSIYSTELNTRIPTDWFTTGLLAETPHTFQHLMSVESFSSMPAVRLQERLESQQTVLEAMRTDLAEIKDLLKSHLSNSVADSPQREVGDDVAKAEILALFENSAQGPLYYDEIADALDLPLRQVVEVCNSLEADGLIGERA